MEGRGRVVSKRECPEGPETQGGKRGTDRSGQYRVEGREKTGLEDRMWSWGRQ